MKTIDHVRGSVHASVTVLEYGDFECPNCKQVAAALNLLLERFAGRVQLAYRHFPLQEVHFHALHAALAAEAAGAQNKFWPMHDLMFEHQNHLKLKQLRGYAERLKLDMLRYDADMEDELHLQRVREHMESGRLLGVRATPTFFINGVLHDVSFGFQSLFDRVEATLKAATSN